MTKQDQRFHAAVAAMQGILSGKVAPQDRATADFNGDGLASYAVEYADALLAELEKTAPKDEPQPDAGGWHRHIPGDPMPDIKAERIDIMTRDGAINSGNPKYFDFGISFGDDSDEIVAWRVVE
jgi:hypothetical protein